MCYQKRLILFATVVIAATLFCMLPAAYGQSQSTVFINEIMASNTQTLADEDDDYPDWIELHNTGDAPLQLENYSLSDDVLELAKWTFPAVSIPAGGYLTILLSGKDRTQLSPQTILHTNFKLNANRETLLLTDTEGAILDSLTITDQNADISYGRSPDGSGTWRYFSSPTPGAENGSGYIGYASAATASVANGFYTSAQSISLTTDTPGGSIRYTTDGSLPSNSSPEYLSPVAVDTTTVIRAMVVADGYLDSPVLTQTYIIDEDSSIPVVSIAIDPYDLWDDETGIYVEGVNGIPGGYIDSQLFPAANWNQSWEKPAHIEFFESNGSVGFSTDVGVRIHGKQNRRLPQKSFAVFFRDEYGLDELEYPLFPDTEVTSFKSFILRNSGHDWKSTHMRDMYLQSLYETLDLEIQHGRPTHAYINGVYWGILNLRDKLNEDYLASHKNADPDAVDIIDDYHTRFTQSGIFQAHPLTQDATTWTCYVSEGTADHYNALLEYMVNHDESDTEVYEYIKTQVDVDNFADYMISRIFIGDFDGPGHNAKMWRPQTSDGRWRWLMYDTDFGAGLSNPNDVDIFSYYLRTVQSYSDNTLYNQSNAPDANFMLYSLLGNNEHDGNADFRAYFINRYADLLNTIFKRDVITSKFVSLKTVIEPEISRHIDRWGLIYGQSPGSMKTKAEWDDNVSVLEAFADQRTEIARDHLRSVLDLGSEVSLTVNNASTSGGSIRLNTLELADASFTGIYFNGVPVQLTAIPKPGYRFDGWSGTSTSSETTISLSMTGATTITANFVEDATATNTVVINEICYNASDDHPSADWVELHSTYTTPLDLSGWKLMDSDETHAFTIPSGTTLESGGYLVLCRDLTAFAGEFPLVTNAIGSLSFGLTSDGELIQLVNSQDVVIDSLTFSSDTPWPTGANGTGPTLELSDPLLDNSLASSWELSDGNGTPGAANSTPVSVDTHDSGLPTAFTLGQNFPNPFNPSTTIPFSLPSESIVKLEVFNSLGQRIAIPQQGRMEAGQHAIRFDASHLPSGMYMYRLTADSFTSYGRMLLIK